MRYFSFILFFLLVFQAYGQSELADNYISTYKDIAIEEMHRTGIPASITLAQGLLESNWGRSELAVKSNNHFGIKCSNTWEGEKHFRYDDDYDEFGRKRKSCFRVYEHAEASFYDHSEFLADPKKNQRYGFLFELSREDYEGWAHGLKKAGYATDPKYGHKLVKIIEKYHLHQYDLELPDATYAAGSLSDDYRITYVNSCKVVIAKGGEDLNTIGEIVGVSSRKLLSYNSQIEKRKERLARGERIFLEARKNYYLGDESFHQLKEGQDLAYLSTLYGIDIEYLKEINDLDDETDVKGRKTLRLTRNDQWVRVETPKKRSTKKTKQRNNLAENSIYIFEEALTPVKN
jgi:hypothetical protein